MTDNHHPHDAVPETPDVAERNVGRLLEKAYKPKAPDTEFVQRVRDRLAAAAAERRVPRRPLPLVRRRVLRHPGRGRRPCGRDLPVPHAESTSHAPAGPRRRNRPAAPAREHQPERARKMPCRPRPSPALTHRLPRRTRMLSRCRRSRPC